MLVVLKFTHIGCIGVLSYWLYKSLITLVLKDQNHVGCIGVSSYR